ncbi:hypothetical protein L9F63_019058, partial [Diploptera punctata]
EIDYFQHVFKLDIARNNVLCHLNRCKQFRKFLENGVRKHNVQPEIIIIQCAHEVSHQYIRTLFLYTDRLLDVPPSEKVLRT